MTEKRFKLDSEVGFIDIQKCGGDTVTLFEVVVELNKLNEENEQLKKLAGLLKNDNVNDVVEVLNLQQTTIWKLKRENEQLKKENHGIQDKVIRLLDYVEVKQCITRTEIKKWWNGDVE